MTATRAPEPSPVMTLAEVAEYLRIHPSTAYRLVRRGRLPAFKMARDYRFNRETIERWVFEQSRESRSHGRSMNAKERTPKG
jgi:excisionase family DNA binding protein